MAIRFPAGDEKGPEQREGFLTSDAPPFLRSTIVSEMFTHPVSSSVNEKVKRLSFRIVFLSFVLLLLGSAFPKNVDAFQNKKLRVYVLAGQSNCVGASGLVPCHTVDESDWKTPYVYKMLSSLNDTSNPASNPSSWKNSGHDGSGQIGTRISHMLYPFNSLLREENKRRLEANIERRFDDAKLVDLKNGETNDFSRGPASFGFNSFVGPEVEFARWMRKHHEQADVAVIKVAVGSSTMNDWEPARRLWIDEPTSQRQSQRRVELSDCLFCEHLLPTVNASLETLSRLPGYSKVELAGFVWIQGESDLSQYTNRYSEAQREQAADDYEQCFEVMVDALRKAHNRQMSFAICLTHETEPFVGSKAVSRLQSVQKRIAERDPLGIWVDTSDVVLVDGYHWDTRSIQRIGERSASRLSGVESK